MVFEECDYEDFLTIFHTIRCYNLEVAKRKLVVIGRCEYGENELLKVIYSHVKNSEGALAKIITCKKVIFFIG